jgi:hypothetical protein
LPLPSPLKHKANHLRRQLQIQEVKRNRFNNILYSPPSKIKISKMTRWDTGNYQSLKNTDSQLKACVNGKLLKLYDSCAFRSRHYSILSWQFYLYANAIRWCI